MSDLTSVEQRRFNRFYLNISNFVERDLCGDLQDMEDFIPGTQRIDFYEDYIRGNSIYIEDFLEETDRYGGLSYEEALFNRVLLERPFNMLILVGGLGSGKSTSMKYLQYLFDKHKNEIDERFPCACRPCQRKPIYVNFGKLNRRFQSGNSISLIFREIRFQLYGRLVEEWLISCGIAPDYVQDFDEGYKVLRRLMIVNDLQKWAQRAYPGEYPLRLEIADFSTEPLFGRQNIKIEVLQALVARFREGSARVAAEIDKVTEHLHSEAEFTSLLLRFYTSRCARWKPSSTLIIDNLDHLPTDTIEIVTDQLASFASRGLIPPIVVPIRPSSLGSRAFDRLPSYMHHYGPNCFHFLLHRLQKYVLNRSIASLSGNDRKDKLPSPFVASPSQDELYAFLVATYLYSKILTAGLGGEAIHLTKGEYRLPKLHSDFAEKLGNLRISEGAISGLSETISALVGTCARYGVAQLKRYFETIYHRADMLAGVLRAGITQSAPVSLRLGYSQIIRAVLSHSGHDDSGRIANLYKPFEGGANQDLPSLASLRLLVELGIRKRESVRQLLRFLALYGIPREIGILALNYLHDKGRLLVWFSKNNDLLGGDTDLDQYVTISEHGLSYLRHVVGDFEYIWFCAGEIPPRNQQEIESNFRTRLEEYARIIQSLALTEWKQLAFVRCIAAEEDKEKRSVINSHQMLTLRILYSSLERAITSSRISLAVAPTGSNYHQNVASLVARVCKLILTSQARYKVCYGDSGYLIAYKDQLARARPALREILQAGVLEDEEQALVREVLDGWEGGITLADSLAKEKSEASLPPEKNFSLSCMEISRGIIPGLMEFLETFASGETKEQELLKYYFWQFLRSLEKVVALLEGRLPTYSSAERDLHHLLEYTKKVIDISSINPAKGLQTLEWLISEESWMRGQLEGLRENKLRIGELGNYAQMDDAKDRFNKIMRIFEALARHYGARQWDHLTVQWY